MQSIQPAELWVVEPADKPEQFARAIVCLLNDGVDLAFGEGDTLPTEPPESLDGVKMVLVYLEDLPRIQKGLRGFRGFDPDGDPPFDASEGIWLAGSTKDPQRMRDWFVQTYLHRNDRTWLAVYGKEALGFPNRIQAPLLLTGDLTLKSERLRERLLARPDRWIRDLWIEQVILSNRRGWGDITFNHGKQLLDDYEVTGDKRCLETAKRVFTEMLADPPSRFIGGNIFPACILTRLYEITGDAAYIAPAERIATEALDGLFFQKGTVGWCHAANAFAPATRDYLLANGRGDMGSYAEQMAGLYLPMLAVAKYTSREEEITARVVECVKTLAANLRDERTGLYWHGLPARKARQPGFMGHGVGWSAFGLSGILEILPTDHPDYDTLLGLFRDLCDAAAKCQGEDGGFHSILDVPWTLFNIHYTGWLGYVFLRGARLGLLDPSFRERGLRAWQAIKARTFQGGVIAAAGGSPVARSFDYYIERFGELRPDVFERRAGIQGLYTLNEALRVSSPGGHHT